MNKIIIYTNPTCPHCIRAKQFLNDNNYNYIEKDLSSDTDAGLELQSHKIMSVPTFKINGNFIVGFDQKKIINALKQIILQCPNCNKNLRLPSNLGKIKITCPHCNHVFIKKI